MKKLVKIKTKPVSYYKKKADKLFSDFIRDRDGWKCLTCGKEGDNKSIQCGHYETRGCIQLRYHEKNAHAQCVVCNIFKKGNYPVYAVKMLEKYGPDILYELDEVYKKSKIEVGKFGVDFYKEIIKKYTPV
jgi:hypothetical protein